MKWVVFITVLVALSVIIINSSKQDAVDIKEEFAKDENDKSSLNYAFGAVIKKKNNLQITGDEEAKVDYTVTSDSEFIEATQDSVSRVSIKIVNELPGGDLFLENPSTISFTIKNHSATETNIRIKTFASTTGGQAEGKEAELRLGGNEAIEHSISVDDLNIQHKVFPSFGSVMIDLEVGDSDTEDTVSSSENLSFYAPAPGNISFYKGNRPNWVPVSTESIIPEASVTSGLEGYSNKSLDSDANI
jgi:hypothetical protein